MKQLFIIAMGAFIFAACTTKETTKETTIETVTQPPAPVTAPSPEKQNKFEAEISDSGSVIKVKLP